MILLLYIYIYQVSLKFYVPHKKISSLYTREHTQWKYIDWFGNFSTNYKSELESNLNLSKQSYPYKFTQTTDLAFKTQTDLLTILKLKVNKFKNLICK